MAGFDINQIFQQAQQIQEQLRKAQESLGQKQVVGDAGGGMVTITATGRGEVLRVQIDPRVVDKADVPMLEDLVLAAVNAALANARALAQEDAGPLSSLQDLIPGLIK
ncbi:MAG: YbaB/EbfC family nucleoid-associated protein [Myxococcales bacterium]